MESKQPSSDSQVDVNFWFLLIVLVTGIVVVVAKGVLWFLALLKYVTT